MEIKTFWLSKQEVSIAIQQYASGNFNNGVSVLMDVTDTCRSAVDVIYKIDSIDDDYFGLGESYLSSSTIEMISTIVTESVDNSSRLYLFFIKDYFCGILLIKE